MEAPTTTPHSRLESAGFTGREFWLTQLPAELRPDLYRCVDTGSAVVVRTATYGENRSAVLIRVHF